jgi:hypothetical protein
MAEIDDLWEMAEAALAEARTLPWGPERIEALKNGILRSRAAEKQLIIDQQRPANPRVRQDWSFLQDSTDRPESTET